MGYAVNRYGVKDGTQEENRALIEKVFEALDKAAPPAVKYLVFELENGEFVHIVSEDTGASFLPTLDAFKAFLEHHAERRSTPVMRSPARVIGNYRMLASAKADS